MALVRATVSASSTRLQRFVIPAGVRTLSFDFQVLSPRSGDWEGAVLEAVITTSVGDYRVDLTNAQPTPFVWTKTADEILASVARFCHRTSNSGH